MRKRIIGRSANQFMATVGMAFLPNAKIIPKAGRPGSGLHNRHKKPCQARIGPAIIANALPCRFKKWDSNRHQMILLPIQLIEPYT
jgi:hypothetical protein